MNTTLPSSSPNFANGPNCKAVLSRLIGNLRGFFYRRRHDSPWTMDFLSEGFRDVTGYDPHRFIANASIAFGDLVAPVDKKRVNEKVTSASRHDHRLSFRYHIRTAYGAWARVEDRLALVRDAGGKVVAIEGVIDLARSDEAVAWSTPRLGEFQSSRAIHATA